MLSIPAATKPTTVDVADAAYWDDPHSVLRAARERRGVAFASTGEPIVLRYADVERLAGVEFHIMGTGFTWDTQDRDKDIAAAGQLWQKAEAMLANTEIGLVVLDEMTYMLSYDYLDETRILSAIRNRPAHQHVVITGRAAKQCLVDLADTVTELKDVKHAFRQGVKAMPGIEW